MQQPTRQQIVQTTLRARALDNRGTLPPRHLAQFGTTLVDLLTGQRDDIEPQATQFTARGLALTSVMAAGTALHQALIADGDYEQLPQIAERLAAVVSAMNRAEVALVRQEQEQLRAAVTRALTDRQIEAERLTILLQELSTPIVPIYDGILVLPLIGAIDTGRANEIMGRLLEQIRKQHAESVIIDITGVPLVDTSVAQHLLQTAQAARLLGASVILVGISPEIAQTIVQLGIDLGDISTLPDLQAGVTVALS
ncbi:MAG: STAS domain-containing protein, partial [Chloroflexi bacterium]|nr:STAS domain-containing protein [Chloroflexota bacterium]